MAGAIIEMINNPEQAILYGQNARKKALVRHDREAIVKSLLKTYQDIINNK